MGNSVDSELETDSMLSILTEQNAYESYDMSDWAHWPFRAITFSLLLWLDGYNRLEYGRFRLSHIHQPRMLTLHLKQLMAMLDFDLGLDLFGHLRSGGHRWGLGGGGDGRHGAGRRCRTPRW